MNLRFVSALAVCAAVSVAPALASTNAPARRPSAAQAVTVDDNYILALSTADDFLHAWAQRDAAAARALLTPAAIKRQTSDELTQRLVGVSSPHHESYEVGRGRKLSATRYAFDVVLYQYLTDMGANGPRPAPSRIVVVEVSPGRWLVDSFPDAQN